MVFLALCLFAADSEPTPAAAPAIEYSLLTIDGQPAGYQTHVESDQDGRTVTDEVMKMQVPRFGQTFTMTTQLQETAAADGSLDGFTLEIRNNGQSMQRLTGRRDGSTLSIEQTIAGAATTRAIELPDGVLAASAVTDRIKGDGPLPEGESQSFRTFSPETLTVITQTVTGLGERETTDRDGQPVTLAAESLTRSDVALGVTQFYDADGEVVRTDLGLMDLVAWPVSREEALAAAGTGTVDFGLKTTLPVDPIPGLARASKATLIVRGASGLPVGVAQRVQPVPDSDAVRATLRRIDCRLFSGVGDAEAATLASSRLIDVDSAEVQDLLQSAPQRGESAGQTAADLERFVRRTVSQTSFGYGFGSASDTVKNRSGDCSECAVLLAALLRGRKIPSRVAYGLVYSESGGRASFVPHMWTEARLRTKSGRDAWVPLDATRAQAGITPTHLCFGTDALASDAPLAVVGLVSLSNSLEGLSIVSETASE